MNAWTLRAAIAGMTLTIAVGGCGKPADPPAGQAARAQQISWREGDVDDAFAEAREQNKPVLLYWGAKWCPPCNLMKQTLFKDPAFIAETRNFIPVHLDGDMKGAQVWGEKFGITGYPTVIILRPDRSEVTRLAGGSTADTLAGVLKLAATRTTSTEDLLKRADDPAKLSADDWRLLASFDWLDDPKHFGDLANGAGFVNKLAAAAPDPAIKRHFALTALMMGMDDDKPALAQGAADQVRAVLPAVLANYAEVKANRQELSYAAPKLIAALPTPAERQALGGQLIAAMDRVAADPAVPLGDRLSAVSADIALAKAANGGKPSPAVLAKVRQRVAAADKAATDPQMRQAVIPTAGQLLADAGDPKGGARLLEAELPRAVAPYYFMVDLASIAEEAGDKASAVRWLKRAAETAQGPATRVQWAVMYSQGVLRLAPDDKAAVEQSAGMVIDALGQNAAGYAQRTQKKAGDWAKAMRAWSAKHGGGEVMARLEARMAKTCGVGGCSNVLKA